MLLILVFVEDDLERRINLFLWMLSLLLLLLWLGGRRLGLLLRLPFCRLSFLRRFSLALFGSAAGAAGASPGFAGALTGDL